MEEIIKRLEACNRALEYAAWNYDCSTLDQLEPGVIESTGVGTTCLIEIRNNNEMIKELFNIKFVIDNE